MFGGILSGYGQASREKNLMDLQLKIQQQDKLAKAYEHFANLPDIPDDLRQEFMLRGMQVLQAPPGKVPKQLADLTPFVTDYLTKQGGKQQQIRGEVAKRPAFEAQMEPPPAAPGIPSPQMQAPPMQFPGAAPSPEEAAFLKRDSIFKSPEEVILWKQRVAEADLRTKAKIHGETAEAERKAVMKHARDAIVDLKLPPEMQGKVALSMLGVPYQVLQPPPTNLQSKEVSVDGKPTQVNFDPHTGKYTDASGMVIDASRIQPAANRQSPGEIDREVAFGAYAAKLGKPVEKLTATEKVEALDTFYEQTGQGGVYPIMRNGQVVYANKREAMGQPAARTVYDMSGMPSTGGQPGIALTPPPNVSESAQLQLSDMISARQQFRDIDPLLNDPKFKTLGPVFGRVTMAEVEKLGGLGATPQEIEMATRLRRLMSTQAFANGGKQLTGTEKEEFIATTPSMKDTVAQALVKARVATQILDRNIQNRLAVMGPRQRGQIEGNVNRLAAPPGGGSPGAIPQVGETFQGKPILKVEKVK